MIELHWRWHDSSQTRVRVWRTDWLSDQFEVMTAEDFEPLKRAFARFSFRVVEQVE